MFGRLAAGEVTPEELQRENSEKNEQLASLQLMASEVSVALGLK